MNAYEYSAKAFELSKEGRLLEASELVKEGLSIYPANPYLLNRQIYLYFKMGKNQEARQEAEEQFHTLKSLPNFLQTYVFILARAGAHDDMLRLADSGVFKQNFQGKANPKFFVSAAKTYANASMADKAVEILRCAPQSAEIDRAIEDMEKFARKTVVSNNKYAEQFKGKRTADVITEIEGIRLLSSYKYDIDLHLYLADRYKKAKQFDKAVEIYKYLLTLKDDDFIRNKLGHAYKQMGNFDDAITFLKEGLLKDPHRTHLHTALVEIYTEKKDPEGFERVVKEVLAVHPDAGHLYGLLRRIQKACSA